MNITTTAFKHFLKESLISPCHVNTNTNANANAINSRSDNGSNDHEPHRLASEIVIFYQTQEIERFRVQNVSLRFINDLRQKVIVDQHSIIANKDQIINNHQEIDAYHTELIELLRGTIRNNSEFIDAQGDLLRNKCQLIDAQRENMYRLRNHWYILVLIFTILPFLLRVDGTVDILCQRVLDYLMGDNKTN